MAKIHVVRIDCDTVECGNYAEVPNARGAATALRTAGWVTWQRGSRTFDLCSDCDAAALSGLTANTTSTPRRLHAVG